MLQGGNQITVTPAAAGTNVKPENVIRPFARRSDWLDKANDFAPACWIDSVFNKLADLVFYCGGVFLSVHCDDVVMTRHLITAWKLTQVESENILSVPLLPLLQYLSERRFFVSVKIRPTRARRMLTAYAKHSRIVADLRLGVLAPAALGCCVEVRANEFPAGHLSISSIVRFRYTAKSNASS